MYTCIPTREVDQQQFIWAMSIIILIVIDIIGVHRQENLQQFYRAILIIIILLLTLNIFNNIYKYKNIPTLLICNLATKCIFRSYYLGYRCLVWQL